MQRQIAKGQMLSANCQLLAAISGQLTFCFHFLNQRRKHSPQRSQLLHQFLVRFFPHVAKIMGKQQVILDFTRRSSSNL